MIFESDGTFDDNVFTSSNTTEFVSEAVPIEDGFDYSFDFNFE